MKLEVGKFYKDRAGNKVYVMFIRPEWAVYFYPVEAFNITLKDKESYTLSGKYNKYSEEYAIVSEWEEPKTFEQASLEILQDKLNELETRLQKLEAKQ